MVRRILNKIPFFGREVTAKDIMTKNPLTVNMNASAQNIAKIMSNRRVGTVVVVRNKKPVGIVTDTDLTKRIVASAKDPKKLKAKDIMSSPLLFALPNDKINDVVSKMKKHRVKRMPIIDREKLVGILTTTDIARTTPEMMDLLEARLLMREEEPSFIEGETSGICENCGNYSEVLIYDGEKWVCEECRE